MNTMKHATYLIFGLELLIILLTFGDTRLALAQFNTLLPTSISLTLSPENPASNQNVNASIESFDTNLDAATISWAVGGRILSTGKGIKTFSFTTGSTNTTTTLRITVKTQQGEVVTKSYPIHPTEVDLIWQARGHTPPFYKGKNLFSYEDRITFIALPHITNSAGKEIPADNFIYKWTRDGSVIADFSGYGKNTYTLQSSIISRPLDIQVDVTSPASDAVGSAETIVTPVDPTVLLYEKHPTLGIQFQKALTNTSSLFDSKEIEVVAEPYFFGVTSPYTPLLSYKWSINSVPIDEDTTKVSRIFRQKEGVSGTSNISLSVENTDQILQLASTNFNIQFGEAAKN